VYRRPSGDRFRIDNNPKTTKIKHVQRNTVMCKVFLMSFAKTVL